MKKMDSPRSRTTNTKTKDVKKAVFDWQEEKRKKEEAAKRAIAREERRVKNMKCPVCQSTKKEHVVKTDNNGVFGPGGHSWVTEEYYVCKNCGAMYKDLKKPKKKPGYDSFDDLLY